MNYITIVDPGIRRFVAESSPNCHGDRPARRIVTQISRIAPGASLEVLASVSVGVRHGAVALAGAVSEPTLSVHVLGPHSTCS